GPHVAKRVCTRAWLHPGQSTVSWAGESQCKLGTELKSSCSPKKTSPLFARPEKKPRRRGCLAGLRLMCKRKGDSSPQRRCMTEATHCRSGLASSESTCSPHRGWAWKYTTLSAAAINTIAEPKASELNNIFRANGSMKLLCHPRADGTPKLAAPL